MPSPAAPRCKAETTECPALMGAAKDATCPCFRWRAGHAGKCECEHGTKWWKAEPCSKTEKE